MTIALGPKPLSLARTLDLSKDEPIAQPVIPVDRFTQAPPATTALQVAPLRVAAPTGLEAKSFSALIAKLGLTEAVKDGLITEAEAEAAGVGLAPLVAAAAREGDQGALDDYSELLSAAPKLGSVTRAQLQAGIKADYVVFAPRESHDALQPLLAHRSLKGLNVALVDPADVGSPATVEQLTDVVKRSGAKFVMLVGDARTGQVPASQLEAKDFGHAYMNGHMWNEALRNNPAGGPPLTLPEQFASDNAYGLPSKKGVPTVAVGRVPARTPEELVRFVGRVIDYEGEAPASLAESRINVADGQPMWGPTKDKIVDRFAEEAIRGSDTEAWDAQRISHNPSQPTAPYATGAQGQALRDGGLFFQYYGHGLSTWIDGLNVSDVGMIGATASQPTPLVAIMACLTGQYAGGMGAAPQSLAESLVMNGPALSAIAASDISLPHSNAGLGAAIAQEAMGSKSRTVGELMVEAKRRYEKNDVDGIAGTINGVGHAAWSAGRVFKKLGDDEKSHLYMYNLIGDPAMELRRPERLSVSGPKSVTRGEALALDVKLPAGLRDGVAYVSFDVPGAVAKPETPGAPSTVLTVAVPIRDGKLTGPVQLPPTMRKGRFNVRVTAVGEELSAIGVLEGVRVG